MHSYYPQKSKTVTKWDYASYQQFIREAYDEDNNTELHNLLRAAIDDELTTVQRRRLLMYYADGYKMTYIAAREGVNPATVCRSIEAGRKHIRKAIKYGAKKLLKAASEMDD